MFHRTGFSARSHRRIGLAAVGGLLLSALVAPPAFGHGGRDGNAQNALGAARARARALVARMTLDEKLSMVHGVGFVSNVGFAGKVAAIPRLGIPELVLADGPNGVGNGATGV